MYDLYLDTASTTQVDPDIATIIYETMLSEYGNPSSLYKRGRDAQKIVEEAQEAVLKFLGSRKEKDRVIFTGSGSEANTLALQGWKKAHHESPNLVMSTPIEHASINNQPGVFWCVRVDSLGMVDMYCLETILEDISKYRVPTLFSIQYANNEIGVMQKIGVLCNMIHRYPNCYLHVDATQAIPYCLHILETTDIDMITMSFHKIHCPKGIACLYIRDGIKLEPIIYGGQQMYGLRPGTENVPYIAGIPTALHKAEAWLDKVPEISKVQKYCLGLITNNFDDVIVNGSTLSRLVTNINVSFKGIDAEALIAMLDTDGICVSAGSACHSHSIDPSHVLEQIGVKDDYIYGSIRITIDEHTTIDDIDHLVECMKGHIDTLREMTQEKNLR